MTLRRSFQSSHEWLEEFKIDLRRLDYKTWLLLGEAVSKVEHIAGIPLDPQAAAYLHTVNLAKGALATTAIEGNTLSEDEAIRHLNKKLVLPPSRQYLGQEIDNIVEACNIIGQNVIGDGANTITVEEIQHYNRLVLKALPLPDEVQPGRFRTHAVVVGRYGAAPAEDCRYLLEEFCKWINGLRAPAGMEAAQSILVAIAAHLYFVWIHPFADGNGRTARLIEFRYLLQAGFPTPAAHLLSNFYNQTRSEYYRQLDSASRSRGRMEEFISYAAQGLVDQLRQQIEWIRQKQWDVVWHNYVHEQFGGKESSTNLRRKRLVLELSKVAANQGWVSVPMLSQLSPHLAVHYARKTARTLLRDLDTVTSMKLVERSGPAVRANKSLILAFLPARAAVPGPSDIVL